MNREQRRKLNLSAKESAVLTDLINMSKVKKALDDWKPIAEGTKVKLNMERITSHPDWNPNTDDFNHRNYVDWVTQNKDNVFTIKYDSAHLKDPQLLCFIEDNTNPKWLFHESDLIVLEEDK
jgi:hypothetical protein